MSFNEFNAISLQVPSVTMYLLLAVVHFYIDSKLISNSSVAKVSKLQAYVSPLKPLNIILALLGLRRTMGYFEGVLCGVGVATFNPPRHGVLSRRSHWCYI